MSEDTRLLYCTTGVLLQKLISHKHMHHFTHVILDEVCHSSVNLTVDNLPDFHSSFSVWGWGTPLPPLSIFFLIFSPFHFSLSFIGFIFFFFMPSLPFLPE